MAKAKKAPPLPFKPAPGVPGTGILSTLGKKKKKIPF